VGEKFLHEIRRVTTQAGFFRVCEEFLNHGEPMTLEPAILSGVPGNYFASFQKFPE